MIANIDATSSSSAFSVTSSPSYTRGTPCGSYAGGKSTPACSSVSHILADFPLEVDCGVLAAAGVLFAAGFDTFLAGVLVFTRLDNGSSSESDESSDSEDDSSSDSLDEYDGVFSVLTFLAGGAATFLTATPAFFATGAGSSLLTLTPAADSGLSLGLGARGVVALCSRFTPFAGIGGDLLSAGFVDGAAGSPSSCFTTTDPLPGASCFT
mmetsp:Transcript_14121/g.30203  ORF Transcript_14121/g.30203 Transcript_14121/m.30203 type:complete len:210 (+) Transcript_14121:1729-2358(+)